MTLSCLSEVKHLCFVLWRIGLEQPEILRFAQNDRTLWVGKKSHALSLFSGVIDLDAER
jgi:hypothetical protein